MGYDQKSETLIGCIDDSWHENDRDMGNIGSNAEQMVFNIFDRGGSLNALKPLNRDYTQDEFDDVVKCLEERPEFDWISQYDNPNYDYINSIGRQWIFEYTLALSKEMLGYVRGKYSTVPIPGAEVTMNQADLISAATAEKTSLVERLRAYFDETSTMALLERRAQEGTYKKDELGNAPMTIYIA